MLGRSRLILRVRAAVGTMMLAMPIAGHAQQPTMFTQEFVFNGSGVGYGGAIPLNGNLLYRNQQLYGTTYAGGMIVGPNEADLGATDLGAIYQYSTTGASHESPVSLYGFSGPDGAHPNGGLVADARGDLYGTTQVGGAHNLGTVFRLAPPASAGGTWALTTLHSFAGPDGSNPGAGLTFGPNGALYGTTMAGGPASAASTGVVFSLSTSGAMFRVVSNLIPGIGSRSSLIFDPQGNILGTTYRTIATRAAGSLFKVAPDGTYTTVTQFAASEAEPNHTSTGGPIGNIVRDAAGNIYGMLETVDQVIAPQHRQGAAVYEVTAVTHKLVILAILDGLTAQSGVVRDAAGSLYGTTVNGGATGTGSVFVLSPNGTLTTLASLPSANAAPVSGVIFDPTGRLWGTSSAGGNRHCPTSSNVTPTGCGTLFSLSP